MMFDRVSPRSRLCAGKALATWMQFAMCFGKSCIGGSYAMRGSGGTGAPWGTGGFAVGAARAVDLLLVTSSELATRVTLLLNPCALARF